MYYECLFSLEVCQSSLEKNLCKESADNVPNEARESFISYYETCFNETIKGLSS